MKNLKYLLLLVILLTSVNLSAQTARLFGARRLVLDNNDLITTNNVYLVDNTGSLGIDNIGLINGTFPSLCALVDMNSTTKGFLPPRMTTVQELGICGGTPTEGLVLYNLTTHSLDFYNGSAYAQAWTTKGNSGTNIATDFLGNRDVVDLAIRTSNAERMRVLSGGNVAIGTTTSTSRLQITEPGAQTVLNVTSFGSGTGVNITTAASNNLLVVNGIADATVLNVAPDAVWDSRINGDQLVTGIQKIGGSIWLDGNSPTHLVITDAAVNLGTMNFNTTALITNNTQRLFIDGAGNTTITGNLSLTGIAAPPLPAPLMQSLYLDPSNQIRQTPAGVNIVTGIGTVNTIPMWTPDIYKSGNSIMTQTANTGINITPGVATTDGVLIVNGVADATSGNVAGDAVWDERVNGDLLVTGLQKIGGSLWLDGNSATHQILADAPVNIGTTNGNTVALITGGTQQLTIDGSGNTTIAGGNTTINGGGSVTMNVGTTTINEGSSEFAVNGTGSGYTANFNTTGQMGLEVHCTQDGGTNLNGNTHFVDFFDGSSLNRGSIAGQDYSEWFADPINASNLAIDVANGVLSGVLVVEAVAAAAAIADPFEAPIAAVDVANIAAQIAQIAVAQVQYGIQTGIATNTTTGLGYGLGVTYGSSAGDYAEYLKRENISEKLYPGDIVGSKNGLISKNTIGADNIFSISLNPIVLGNNPPKGEEASYNKVAFLGQVPVKVRGIVNQGDFIIASGLNDGIGIAISPDQISTDQFAMVLGRSWISSTFEGVKYVKVAVGLNAKAMSEIMSHEQSEIDALKKEVTELHKSNAEVAAMKTKLDRIEKYLSQPEAGAKTVMLKSN